MVISSSRTDILRGGLEEGSDRRLMNSARIVRVGKISDICQSLPYSGATRESSSRLLGADGSLFARLTRPRCCRVIDFSDTAPTFLLPLQIL